MKLEGKTALVTGPGKGIGRAIALLFAQEGASVVAADVDEEAGQAIEREIAGSGGSARFLRTDVSREEQIQAAIEATVDTYGRLDIMVNNAGVLTPDWQATLDVNLSGVYYGCLHATAAMAKSGGGVIINLASILGLVGLGLGMAPYTVTKHGVIGITREFALANAARNIRVNCICPGFVETEMIGIVTGSPELVRSIERQTPVGRLARPEEIAKAALFLASDDSSYVTGAPLIVDGGWTAR